MRECGTCTKCCEGSLGMTINGEDIYGKGCPLVLLNKGCGDYENRPAIGCGTFKCGWLKNPDVPEEFKPNLIDVIILFPIKNPNNMGLVPTGGRPIPEDVLHWADKYSLNNNLDLIIR